VRDTAVDRAMIGTVFVGALSLVGSLAVVAIYLFGGRSVIASGLTLGTVVALATLAQRIYTPVVDLASTRIRLVQGLVAFERVYEVLDAPLAIEERAGALNLQPVTGRVEVKDVWFRYPAPSEVSIASMELDASGETRETLSEEPSEWLLRGISLTAEPGTMTALVGMTGVGKTSLCYLVARLYDVTRGAVLIDGHDVRDLSFDTLNRAVGMVTQDPHLHHDTVAANLRLGRPDATDEMLAEACRVARISDLIESLPDGYETIAGERGYRFSGGEKQRLAIARVILKDPAIIVLDEATSHLDNETEALVQEALNAALRGRTSIVIAHRLSTIQGADQILVLEDGQVREQGVHLDLLRAGGLYATLHRRGDRA
jgi:ATP-binding cassette subfamily B protein